MARKARHTGRRRAVGRRPAFLLQGPMMLGIMLLGVVVYIGVMTAFTGIIQGSIVESLTDVPTMYEYDDKGVRMMGIPEKKPDGVTEAEWEKTKSDVSVLLKDREDKIAEIRLLQAGTGTPGGGDLDDAFDSLPQTDPGTYEAIKDANDDLYEINAKLRDLGWINKETTIIHMYSYFAVSATVLLVIMMIFSAAGHFMEKGFGVWRQGTAAGMFKGAIIGLIIIWLLPQVWDFFALGMEDLALDTMRMGGDEPQQVIDGLWCKLGATAPCMFNFADVLDPLGWATALTSPSDFGMTLMGKVLLPFFKLVPALTITLTMFVVGEVRVLFISIILIIMPLLVVLKHLPFVKNHADRLIDSLIGAAIAPFFSALTLVVGWEYISNVTTLNSLEEWVQALGIVALAGAWPVMLSPLLSQISSQVSGAVNTAVMSSAMMASQMGTGLAAGAMTAAQQGHGLKGILAGAAMGGGSSMISAMPTGTGDVLGKAKGLGFETGEGSLIMAPSAEPGAAPSWAPGAAGGGGAAGAAGAAVPAAVAGATGFGVGPAADGVGAGAVDTMPTNFAGGTSANALGNMGGGGGFGGND